MPRACSETVHADDGNVPGKVSFHDKNTSDAVAATATPTIDPLALSTTDGSDVAAPDRETRTNSMEFAVGAGITKCVPTKTASMAVNENATLPRRSPDPERRRADLPWRTRKLMPSVAATPDIGSETERPESKNRIELPPPFRWNIAPSPVPFDINLNALALMSSSGSATSNSVEVSVPTRTCTIPGSRK